LKLSNNPKLLIRKLIEGISYLDLMKGGKKDYITEPLDNIYFQRDGYASIGNNVSIHHMKYNIRNRETLIYELVFSNHPKFFNTKQVYSRNSKLSLEGGDVFPYTKETLVVGVSERTTLKAIANLAKNMIKEQTKFKQIIAINVPKTGRLMHLDT
jgi:arginine deiminase